MRKSVILFCLVIAALLAACQRAPDPVPLPLSISAVEAPVSEEIAVELEVLEAAPAQPLPNECLNCHSDKQRLIDTAKAEEVVESESEGVG
jgi:hypothetical protein